LKTRELCTEARRADRLDGGVQTFFDQFARPLTAGAESSAYILRRDDTGDLKLQVVVMRGMT
jgi:hypothetical protein